jgi:hypothetical protein
MPSLPCAIAESRVSDGMARAARRCATNGIADGPMTSGIEHDPVGPSEIGSAAHFATCASGVSTMTTVGASSRACIRLIHGPASLLSGRDRELHLRHDHELVNPEQHVGGELRHERRE